MRLGDSMQKISELIKITEKEKAELKADFIKKTKDSLFNEVINPLKCNDELLYKYTSNLEDAARELGHCQKCSGLEMCKNSVLGYKYTPAKNNNLISFDYVACKFKQKELKETSYKNNIYVFEIPENVKNASLKDLYKDDKNRLEIYKYFKTFMDDYLESKEVKGMYLHGNFGSGKTYLIAALFNELAKKDVRSAIIYVPEFLRILKSSFNGNDFEDRYDYIKNVPLLLLDDIGAENLSGWSRDEIIGTLLQYRMDQNLPTFFTSNLNLAELEEHFSLTNNGIEKLKARRIIERINYLTNSFILTSINRRT